MPRNVPSASKSTIAIESIETDNSNFDYVYEPDNETLQLIENLNNIESFCAPQSPPKKRSNPDDCAPSSSKANISPSVFPEVILFIQ